MQHGDSLWLGTRAVRLDAVLGRGGGGTVWTLQSPDDALLVKLPYEAERLTHIAELIRRLDLAQLRLPYQQVAAPREIATVDGRPVGYSMPYVRGDYAPLEHLFPSSRGLEDRLEAAGQLAELISNAHSRSFVIGDLCPANLLWSPADGSVLAIDVDSWGYHDTAAADSAPFPGFARPAVERIPLGQLPRLEYSPGGSQIDGVDQNSDRFALGLIVLEILTGEHPFGPALIGIAPTSTAENIRDGRTWLADPRGYALDQDRFPGGHPGLAMLPQSRGQRALFDLATRVLRPSRAKDYPFAYEWAGALGETRVRPCPTCGAGMLAGAECVACRSRGDATTDRLPAGQRVVATVSMSDTAPLPTRPVRRVPVEYADPHADDDARPRWTTIVLIVAMVALLVSLIIIVVHAN